MRAMGIYMALVGRGYWSILLMMVLCCIIIMVCFALPGGVEGMLADKKACAVDTRVGYADGQKTLGWNVLDWSNGWPVAT